MASGWPDHLFKGFEVEDESKTLLADLVLSRETPSAEKNAVYDTSLISGWEDWNLLLHCAATIRQQARQTTTSPLDADDLLAFVPTRCDHSLATLREPRPGWAETDRLIRALGESLQASQGSSAWLISRASLRPADKETHESKKGGQRSQASRARKSSYWACPVGDHHGKAESSSGGPQQADLARPRCSFDTVDEPTPAKKTKQVHFEAGHKEDIWPAVSSSIGPAASATTRSSTSSHNASLLGISDDLTRLIPPPQWTTTQPSSLPSTKSRSPVKSPFFAPTPASTPPAASPQGKTKTKRRPAGTVSALPFPPLTAPSFDLVQEKLAHEPFWLLIAVTFLIKTAGKLAIPTFYRVKERFPTPAHLADPDSAATLTDMTRHLGLSVVRTGAIQRYARGWIERPPRAGVTFRVKGYDKRERIASDMAKVVGTAGVSTDGEDEGRTEDEATEEKEKKDGEEGALEAKNSETALGAGEADDAWEMGHLTQGRYAMDSWRIFCRDKLLGRAQDWKGTGAAPEFQPEWMRVRPRDKELRACLRWMWMKEGWEWDPASGEKTVLRPEMERAVNEGRVESDDAGGLKMVGERPISSG